MDTEKIIEDFLLHPDPLQQSLGVEICRGNDREGLIPEALLRGLWADRMGNRVCSVVRDIRESDHHLKYKLSLGVRIKEGVPSELVAGLSTGWRAMDYLFERRVPVRELGAGSFAGMGVCVGKAYKEGFKSAISITDRVKKRNDYMRLLYHYRGELFNSYIEEYGRADVLDMWGEVKKSDYYV